VQNAFALSSGRDSRYLVPTSAKYRSFVSQTTQLFIGSRKASNRICACRFFLSLTLAGVRLIFFETIPLLNDNARFRRIGLYGSDGAAGGKDLTPASLIAA
jgi:hypothetical protein